MYGNDWRGYKPPLFQRRSRSTKVDWVSPDIKWNGEPVGQGLLVTAPRLMHLLALVGTIAMFMVGGGILVHGWPFAHHLIEGAAAVVATLPTVGAVLAAVTPTLLNAVAGVVAGLLLVAAMTLVSRLAPAKG